VRRSDLLSFSADGDATGTDKLAEVKSHVIAMKTMIEEEKDRELKESIRQAEYEEKAARQRTARQADARGRSVPMRVHEEMMMAPEMMMDSAAPLQYEAQFATASMKSAPPQKQKARKDTTDRRRANAKTEEPPHETAKETTPGGGGGGMKGSAVDYTRIAAEMDHQFEQLDPEGVLRPTVISTASPWIKKSSKGLLGKLESKRVTSSLQKDEKASAFGLLDALTRGGGLSVDHAELHIMVAATHQFDKSLTEMVVKDNVNPIERVERSALILASTVHRLPCGQLVKTDEVKRISMSAPALFANETIPLAPN